MDLVNSLFALGGLSFAGLLLSLDKSVKNENESEERFDQNYPKYPESPVFYQNAQQKANAAYAMRDQQGQSGYQMINKYVGPNGGTPQNQARINLNSSGDQLLEYQLYQQAVNASTPTLEQLQSISGEAHMQTGNDSQLQGGVSSDYAPYNVLGGIGSPENYASEFQAVNMGNARAESISACAQNAPSFVATSLLPKPEVPGQETWDISAPQNILATQNFLSATQQLGVDTVLSSLKNPSYDIRGDIPNPINVVSPWMQSTFGPDLQRKLLQCPAVPQEGLYGCNGNNYVGMGSS